METTCTLLGDRAASPGNPTTGRGEPPFLSAESTTPGEADNVANVFCPRNDCTGAVNLPHELGGHQTEPPGPIIEPRDSHELLGERPNLKRLDFLHHGTDVPTIANKVNCPPSYNTARAKEPTPGYQQHPGIPLCRSHGATTNLPGSRSSKHSTLRNTNLLLSVGLSPFRKSKTD